MTFPFSTLSTTLTMSMRQQLEPHQQHIEEDEDDQRHEDVKSLNHDAVSVAPTTAVRLHYIQRYGHSAILPCRSARRIVHLEDDDDAMSASSVEIVFEQDDCLLGDCESMLLFPCHESRAAQTLASAIQSDEVVFDNITNTISRPEEELISFTSFENNGFGPLSEQHPSSQSLYVSKNVDKDDIDDVFETTSSSFMRKQRTTTAASASASQLLVPDSETSRRTLRTDNTKKRAANANANATRAAAAAAASSKTAAAQSAGGVLAKRDTLNDDDSDDGLVLSSAARHRQNKCCRFSGTRIGYSYCSCAALLLMVIVVITVQIVSNNTASNDNDDASRYDDTVGAAAPTESTTPTRTRAPVQFVRRSASPTVAPTTTRVDESVSSFPTATATAAPSLAPINSTTVVEEETAEMTETTTILPSSVPPSSSPTIQTTTTNTTTTPTTLYFTTTQQLYKAVDAYYYYYSYHNNTLSIEDASTVPVPLDVAALQYGYPIGTWDVSRLSNFSHVFSMHRPSTIQGQGRHSHNNARSPAFGLHNGDDLSGWNVSRATTLHAMFMGANFTGKGIEQWQVGKVTDFSYFAQATTRFTANLEQWNTSSAINMEAMFQQASSYVGMGLEAWDTRRVTNMKHTFQKCPWFRGNVSTWNVGKVESFEGTFEYCLFFDADLSNWNVSSVQDASAMFQNAKAFNHSLCSWGLERYDNLTFENGTSWNVTNMFANSGCPNTSDPIVSSSSMTGPLCWNCDS